MALQALPDPATLARATVITPPADATIRPPATGLDVSARGRFFRAPQTVGGFVAALLDPVVILLTLWALHLAQEPSYSRWLTALSLMVIALTFPGRLRLERSPAALALDVALNWVVLLAILVLCVLVTRSSDDVDWALLQQWALITPVVHWSSACALRMVLQRLAQRGHAQRPVVLIGAAPLALRTAQAVGQLEGPRRRVVGYFDDRADTRICPEALAQRLGNLHEASRYIDKLGIREVYITLPMLSQPRMAQLLDALQCTTASLYVVPDVMGTPIVQGRLQDVNGLPVVGICETPFTGTHALAKRCSDLLLAAALLVPALPMMLLAALALRLEAPGPVLQRQRRSGLDGEEIVVFKFRTGAAMAPGAPDEPTRVGRFLRRWCIDSLPQLLNVLQGRMSLVGPRPHAVAHNAQYRQQIKAYMVRQKARPGITGWAQVHGLRGEVDALELMRQRVAYDLEYLRHWSIGLDLRILLRTLHVVVTGALRRR